MLPAIDSEQAIKITEKGIANNPNEWRFYQQLGYIYWRLKEFDRASESYEKGSQIGGAPSFMKIMAAQMKSKGGSRETARAMYEQMLSEAQDTQTKEIANLRLMQLDSIDEREVIQNALNAFKNKFNRCPNNWSEIFPLLKTIKMPNNRDLRIDKANNIVDPGNVPYLIEQKNCSVILDQKSSRIPLE